MLSGFLNVRSAPAKQSVITAINLLGLLSLANTEIFFEHIFYIFPSRSIFRSELHKYTFTSLIIHIQAKRSLRLQRMGHFFL